MPIHNSSITAPAQKNFLLPNKLTGRPLKKGEKFFQPRRLKPEKRDRPKVRQLKEEIKPWTWANSELSLSLQRKPFPLLSFPQPPWQPLFSVNPLFSLPQVLVNLLSFLSLSLPLSRYTSLPRMYNIVPRGTRARHGRHARRYCCTWCLRGVQRSAGGLAGRWKRERERVCGVSGEGEREGETVCRRLAGSSLSLLPKAAERRRRAACALQRSARRNSREFASRRNARPPGSVVYRLLFLSTRRVFAPFN